MKHSPLFVPVLWEGEGFKILDETLLPWRIDYIPARNLSDALGAVKEMKTRAFGQVLTFFYAAALLARGESGRSGAALKERLGHLADEFIEVRPTFDFIGLAAYFEPWFAALPNGTEAGSFFEGKIHELIAGIIQLRTQRAKIAAELLPDPCRLLTHCNVSGEFAAIAHCRREMGKEIRAIATETRPYFQGSRLSAWEMAEAGVAVEVIPDSAVAQVMARGEINAVLVGADRVAKNGDIVNKVGTYPIAVVAKEYGVPFYVLVQEPGGLESGAEVEIEERPASELFLLEGRPVWDREIAGRYPAFDVTPAALITRLIGFDRGYTPEEFREKYRPAPVTPKEKKSAGALLLYGVPKQSNYPSLARALKLEKAEHILVPEMRPELAGLAEVAKNLGGQNIPVEIISDNMMGTFFAQGAIRRLYLFCQVGADGAAGACGSLLAVLLARAHGVPVELLASELGVSAPLDRDVATFMGRRVMPDGVGVHPIAKEIVPWALFRESEAGA